MNIMLMKYFWFFVAAFWFIVLSTESKSMIKKNAINYVEFKKAKYKIKIAICVPLIILGLLQFAGGFEFPFLLVNRNLNNPYIFASWIIILLCWILILGWIWIGKGTMFFERFFELQNIKLSPTLIRWLVTIIILVSFVSLILH